MSTFYMSGADFLNRTSDSINIPSFGMLFTPIFEMLILGML